MQLADISRFFPEISKDKIFGCFFVLALIAVHKATFLYYNTTACVQKNNAQSAEVLSYGG